jgi:hypothetical protein
MDVQTAATAARNQLEPDCWIQEQDYLESEKHMVQAAS